MRQTPTIVRVDRLPELPSETSPGVEVWRDTDGAPAGYGQTVEGRHWMHLPGLAAFRFEAGADEVVAFAPPTSTVDAVVDAYQRAVLPMVLQVSGREVLHASAVLVGGRVVAFCAVSGTGKSTIAYGLSTRGHPLWGDDAVTVDLAGPTAEAVSLPFAIRLDDRSTAFFGGGDGGPRAEPSRAPIEALFVLERAETEGDVELVRLAPADAFPALLVHAYCFSLSSVDGKRRMLEHYLELAERVPVFSVRFSPGFPRLSDLLDRIEAALGTAVG
jgi:hypothetical protein